MRKSILFPLIATIFMVTAIGCSNVLESPPQKGLAGLSGVEISIDGGARTLLPGADLLYYTLAFTSQGKEPVNRTLNGAAGLNVALEPGDWVLNVTGYLNAEDAGTAANALAEGSAAVTVSAGKITPVKVELRAIKEAAGTGTLNYAVTFPEEVQKGTLKLVPITGAGNTQTATLKDGSGGINNSGTLDGLAAGYYRIIMELSWYDEEAGLTRRAAKSRIAHIYAGMETDLAEAFGADAFSGTPTFTTVEDLGAYLAAAAQNSRAEPYFAALKDIDLSTGLPQGLDPLGKLFNALNGRFVSLDLSACTGDFVDATSGAAGNRVNIDRLVSLILPSTVSRIGAYLFYNSGIRSVLWPEAPDEAAIGNYAFSTIALEQVTLPPTLKTIGTYAFYNCGSLVSLDLPGTLESIGSNAFQNCLSLKSLNWPEAPEGAVLGESAFYSCGLLQSVQLPPTLTVIERETFYNCISLESVNLPRDLTSIGNYAFQNCKSLTAAEIPAGVTGQTLGVGAFTGCSSLSSVTLPEGLTWLYTYTFRNTALETITLPASLTNINGEPFTGCLNLRFTVAEGNAVFSTAADGMILIQNQENLERITLSAAPGASGEIAIPEGVTYIAGNAFQRCVSLTGVRLPSTLINIGANAFDGSGIREITIPPSVTAIDAYAFANCPVLEEVSWTSCEGTPSISYYIFQNSISLRSVTLPEGLTGLAIYMFDGCIALRSIDLPAGLTTIGAYAFRNCSGLESIDLPAGLTTIGTNAFQNSGLESIVLPAGLTTISANAFNGCSSLRWVKWPVSPANAYIGANTSFAGCTALERIELPDNLRASPAVTTAAIPANAFLNLSNLKTVVIRTTAVANLGNSNAFSGTSDELKIYVPDGSVNNYTAGTNWSTLSGKIVSDATLGDEAPANW
jgi:hypothetical protein